MKAFWLVILVLVLATAGVWLSKRSAAPATTPDTSAPTTLDTREMNKASSPAPVAGTTPVPASANSETASPATARSTPPLPPEQPSAQSVEHATSAPSQGDASAARDDVKPNVSPETIAAAGTDAKSASPSNAKPEKKPDSTPESKPEAKSEAQSVTKSDAKPAPGASPPGISSASDPSISKLLGPADDGTGAIMPTTPALQDANDAPASASAKSAEHTAGGESAAKVKLEPQDDGTVIVDARFVIKGTGTKADPYRVPWEMLVSTQETYQPRLGRKVIPERVKMLDGKWISINGYIAFPIMAASPEEMLAMLNQWDGCCIGVPPTPFDAIEVKLKKAAKGDDRFRASGTVTGILRVDPYLVKDWLVSLYLMDDGELSNAAGTQPVAPAGIKGAASGAGSQP